MRRARSRARQLLALPGGDSALLELGFDTEEVRRSATRAGRRSRDAAGGGRGGRLGEHNSHNENNYKCVGDSTVIWSNSTAVRKAMHVPVDSYFFNGDNGEGMTYHVTEKDMRPFYKHVAAATELRVLIYNGDTDPSIDSGIAQNWTSHMGYTPTQTWRPWTLDGCRRMGGYVTRYKERFDFLTIRGSGHMVPQYRPEPAYEFLRAWLADEDYKPYVAACTSPPAATHEEL